MTVQIQRHFSKMFAGISSVEVESRTEGGVTSPFITAIISRQGEVVKLSHPVSVAVDPAVNAWLARVEAASSSTLEQHLGEALSLGNSLFLAGAVSTDSFTAWVDRFAAQIVGLATTVHWCQSVDHALTTGAQGGAASVLSQPLERAVAVLSVLAECVTRPLSPERRSKYEQLITELVHQRDVTRHLQACGVVDANDFEWLYQLRYYWGGGAAGAGAGAGAGRTPADG